MSNKLYSSFGFTTPTPAEGIFRSNKTFINEFPHPKFIINCNPVDEGPENLDQIKTALDNHVDAIEIDVIYSAYREPFCVHGENSTIKLRDVLDEVFQRKGDQTTMYNHGRRFFLVIDPDLKLR